MNKLAFIKAAYDEISRLASYRMFADTVRGLELVPHLHSRDTILNVRAVTLRIKGQVRDYGYPAIFDDPLPALSFHNAVRSALKKMASPVP